MSTTVSPHPKPPTWPRSTRILFRFAFCYALLYYTCSLLTSVPFLGDLLNSASSVYRQALGILAAVVFQLDPSASIPHPTGSGDTALDWIDELVTITVAILATALWPAVETALSRHTRPARHAESRTDPGTDQDAAHHAHVQAAARHADLPAHSQAHTHATPHPNPLTNSPAYPRLAVALSL